MVVTVSQRVKGCRSVVVEQDIVVKRVKVLVKCHTCDQRFILRGSPNKDGGIETGFKMCMCGSADVDMAVVERRLTGGLGYRLKSHDDMEVI